MKLPTREPRNEPTLEKYNYYDHESVEQEDGRFASFIFENDKRKEGWRFQGYEDKFGFRIWEEKDHEARWDDKFTYEQVLLDSNDPDPYHSLKESFGPDFRVADDEEIRAYVYGGVLSQRGGWFVVKKNQPYHIIRSIQTWLS